MIKRISAIFVLFISVAARGQSAGAGLVSTIESKASRIEQLLNEIQQRQQDIQQWQTQNQALDGLLKDRLAAKYKEFETSQVWINRLKSAQSGWKEYHPGTCGAGGPPPLCPVDHWYRVPVSEAMKELDDLKNKELQAIYDQTKRDREALAGKIADANKKIADLNDEIDRLRREITAHSLDYKNLVIKDAQSIQEMYINRPLELVAKKHYLEDRLQILSVQLRDLQTEQTQALQDLNDKIAKQNEQDKADLSKKVEANNRQLQQLTDAYDAKRQNIQSAINSMDLDLNQVKNRLIDSTGLGANGYSKLQNRQLELENQIDQLKKQMLEAETQYNNSKDQLSTENKGLSDKIWDLTIHLSDRQAKAAEVLQKAFDLRRKIIQDAIEGKRVELQQCGDELLAAKDAARKKFMAYADVVDKERVRMLKACQKAGCSCYATDTQGTIVANWNTAEGCISEMEGMHHSNDPVYGCQEEAAKYKNYYASWSGNLSDSERKALNSQASRTRYDLILRKITDY